MRHNVFLIPAFILSSTTWTGTSELFPKYIAEPVAPGASRLLKDKHKIPAAPIIAKSLLIPGRCTAGEPFDFPLSSGGGHGIVCVLNRDGKASLPIIDLQAQDEGAYILSFAGKEGSDACVVMSENEGSIGVPFLYADVPSNGTIARITCVEQEDFIVVVLDDVAELQSIEIETTVERTKTNISQKVVRPKLLNGTARISSIKVQTLDSPPRAQHGNNRREKKMKNSHRSVDIQLGKAGDVTLEYATEGHAAVILYELEDEMGKKFYRSYVCSTTKPPLKATDDLVIESTTITEEGDLKLTFSELPEMEDDGRLLCTVRVGVVLTNAAVEHESLVDVSAMINNDNPFLIIHGGWFRKRLHELKLPENAKWDVVVDDAHCENPAVGYQVSNNLHPGSRNRRLLQLVRESDGSSTLRQHPRLLLLSQPPTTSEMTVHEEMLVGRPPRVQRRLQALEHRFILIHGYCVTSSPWPANQFTGNYYNVVQFIDFKKNYNHDQFARSIATQVCPYDTGNVAGNIVAHSQGGNAAVHLKNFYWSCMDRNVQPGKLIQTLATPYQGTPLAGSIAALYSIFGTGCGRNYDLTYAGAAQWLSRLSASAISKTTFYRTVYEDLPWRFDYCSMVTQSLLININDGVVEASRGVLPGAINGDIKSKECHVGGMRDPPSCLDANRNEYMRSNAAIPRG